MTRNEQLIQNVAIAMGNASLTWPDLLRDIQNSHRDVKHVYGVAGLCDRDIKSISIKCIDRTLITMDFERQEIPPSLVEGWSWTVEVPINPM